MRAQHPRPFFFSRSKVEVTPAAAFSSRRTVCTLPAAICGAASLRTSTMADGEDDDDVPPFFRSLFADWPFCRCPPPPPPSG